MTTPTTMFAELFRGRLDAFGTEWGSCHKQDEPTYDNYLKAIRNHLDGIDPIGVYPLCDGRPMLAGSTDPFPAVRWGCSDLDEGDDPTDALNIVTMFAAAGITAWLERSRSKGFHCWVFASEWVPAMTMRNAFLAVHQRLGIPAKEINPKQVILSGHKFGNYVRIAYPNGYALEKQILDARESSLAGGTDGGRGLFLLAEAEPAWRARRAGDQRGDDRSGCSQSGLGHSGSGGSASLSTSQGTSHSVQRQKSDVDVAGARVVSRSGPDVGAVSMVARTSSDQSAGTLRQVVFDSEQCALTLEAFVSAAHGQRTSLAALEAVAARYAPIKVRRVPLPIDVSEGLRSAPVSTELHMAMPPYVRKIFDQPPPEYQDRSSRLMWLAHMARESGFKPDEAYAIVADADHRWGKFSVRADGEQRLSDIVMEAYAWSEV